MKRLSLSLISFLVVISICFAEDVKNTAEIKEQRNEVDFPISPSQRQLPIYSSELSNINDYDGFANGGWDGNWYVGFNVCWIEKFPPPPQNTPLKKVFAGVKLGRMKTRPVTGKPVWEKEPIPGDIYVSFSSTPAWKSNQKYFLVSTEDIPLDADPENVVNGVGESRWFWAEIPLEMLAADSPHYLAVWSPTEYFVSTASSPIIAGGWGSQDANTWLNNDVRGYAPLVAASSLKTPISMFEPGIAMKYIPEGTDQVIQVSIARVRQGRKRTAQKTISAAVTGEGIERMWLEVSVDGEQWKKHGKYIYSPPYDFTLKPDTLPNGNIKVRCADADMWENRGYSTPIEMSVTK